MNALLLLSLRGAQRRSNLAQRAKLNEIASSALRASSQ
jgi:hypothetical protein